ncbi:uncharacterized protein KY384_000060 [Bacidia gigantensis]|uniref:uncharacterized protein n=1 Tax=Bacidia gigantensis TaxID=2732470 RepID=UPI001D059BB7|nr:uncharacterized protein KY384_000060 [Bacidia gigantensis]KAG8526404.1 hypothetical protein KY384_000060 [Bacidia gigantensis]
MNQHATTVSAGNRIVQVTATFLMALTDPKIRSFNADWKERVSVPEWLIRPLSDAENSALVPTGSASPTVINQNNRISQRVFDPTASWPLLSTREISDLQNKGSSAAMVGQGLSALDDSVPHALAQNTQDISLCFFFRHYAGTTFDPESRNSFNQLWQPMYLQAPIQSSLRLATSAVTVHIAKIWRLWACTAQAVRSLFIRAVATTQKSLQEPEQSSTDTILMTILVFDVYDALLLHYDPSPVDYGKHKYGALAVVEHRGFANLATPRARILTAAVRHTLLSHVLSSREGFPERLDFLFRHPSMNDTKAAKLDHICVQLSRVQKRLWTRRKNLSERRRESYKDIIAEALQVEQLLLDWEASITNPDWLPQYVPRDLVKESIQISGFYGTSCIVWEDLDLGDMWVLFSMRYLLALQIIRQACVDDSNFSRNGEHEALVSKTNKKAQKVIDFVCGTVPFFLGDRVVPKPPTDSISISFPYKVMRDPKTGVPKCVPGSKSSHHKQAAASGGWILFPYLVNVWRLAEPEDDALSITLRQGQLEWIKAQVKRMQNVFQFCEPVWFKRHLAT